MDRRGGAELRRRLLSGLSGSVIDVGAGNGRNFAHYPETVTSVLAVEPEPTLREAASSATRNVSVSIQVVSGVAESLPTASHVFDAAVTSLVLCSVADQAAALGEVRRVLRPGGGDRNCRFHHQCPSALPVAGARHPAPALTARDGFRYQLASQSDAPRRNWSRIAECRGFSCGF